MHDLTIIGITIHQDAQKRYSMNDLHEAAVAAGYNKRTKEPGKFFATKMTQELIEELLTEKKSVTQNLGNTFAPVNAISAGPYELRGTYVVKELVYAYAMWISPAFNLKVIRAYDALVTGDIKDRDQRLLRVERAYFERYPQRRTIRSMALKGEPYWYIAQCVRCAPATVGNAIRHMIAWGMMEAQRLLIARTGMGTWWAFRRKHRHQMQLAL